MDTLNAQNLKKNSGIAREVIGYSKKRLEKVE